MNLRGYLALTVVIVALVFADLVQRLVIVPILWLRPSGRQALMTRWAQGMAWLTTRPLAAIGGARIPRPPSVPGGEGVLLVMNHQSLFDIPLLVAAVEGSYPRIVTRKRYAHRIPLISHLIRLYQYPVVDPAANRGEMRGMLDELSKIAASSTVPIGIFPEGTRTKDGEIARFKSSGMKRILASRPWTVYAFVVDGFWERAHFKDLSAGLGSLDGHMELAGKYDWDDPQGDAGAFIRQLRQDMVDRLASMRARSVA